MRGARDSLTDSVLSYNVYFNSSLLILACFKISIKVPFGKSFLWQDMITLLLLSE